MANKKISDLEEALSTDGFYVLGVKESGGSLISAKYNLGTFGDTLLDNLNSVEGQNDIPEFNTTTTYYPGQFVRYQGEIYKFTEVHSPGVWNTTDVTKTSVFTELSNMTGENGDTEVIHFSIIALDASGDVIESDIVKNRVITITMQDGSGPYTITTDNSGQAIYRMVKGKSYAASISSQSGYSAPNSFSGITAEYNDRYLNFIYQAPLSGTGTLTVGVKVTSGYNISDLSDKTISIFRNGSAEYYTENVNTTTGLAVFSDLPLGSTWTVNGAATGFTSNSESVVLNDSSKYTEIVYRKTVPGNAIFLVENNSNFDEYDINAVLQDGTTTLKPEYQGKTWIALHVCTSDSITGGDVASGGYDYYVKLADLVTAPSGSSKSWCTKNGENYKTLSHVSTSTAEMNGRLMTYYMAKDARDTSLSTGVAEISYASEWVITQTLVYKPGSEDEQTLKGFMGTRAQMNPLYTNVDQIYSILKACEYDVTKATSGTYYNRSTWCSSQYSATYAWAWDGACHYWASGNETYTFGVLPLFAL